ncbi:hypothetical protein [Pelagicoccus mobilis]|uniref:Uncharacterized protein n=1 Tax=Pelagicoccus mobilis TaxID=415221 RepID=A0A934S5C0_9BACT|nr:hypothetical protein [Pelagicoccus mobilis]MBK1879684.1 hypothetical protein [Pelagicoccus mobilis]
MPSSEESPPEKPPESPKQLPDKLTFFAELKKRKVTRVAVTYAVVAWLIIQVAAATFGGFGIPVWAFRFVVIMLVLGFPVALILAWAFELTPDGIKTTKAARESRGDLPVPKKQQRKRNWMAFAFAAGLPTLIFGTLAVFFYFKGGGREGTVTSGVEKSVAVLPFVDLSDGGDKPAIGSAGGIGHFEKGWR